MLNIVYLVLVITAHQSVTVEKIPQANMQQCQVNASNVNTVAYKNSGNYKVEYKAKCIVGVIPK